MAERFWVNKRTLVSPRPTNNSCSNEKWEKIFGDEGKQKLGNDPLRYSSNNDGVAKISYENGWGNGFGRDNKKIFCTDKVIVYDKY
jgi:hypothetical protein